MPEFSRDAASPIFRFFFAAISSSADAFSISDAVFMPLIIFSSLIDADAAPAFD